MVERNLIRVGVRRRGGGGASGASEGNRRRPQADEVDDAVPGAKAPGCPREAPAASPPHPDGQKNLDRPAVSDTLRESDTCKNRQPAPSKPYNSTCIPISTTRLGGILKNLVLRVPLRAMKAKMPRRQRCMAGRLAATTVWRDR